MGLSHEEKELIAELLSDKKKFDSFLYTPLRDAISELSTRENDTIILDYLKGVPPLRLPDTDKKYMVLCRNIGTPNYEMHRFLASADVLTELKPYIFEYTKDKYTHINRMKITLGKLAFYKGINKIKQPVIQYKNVIDLNECNGKIIDTLSTVWGQNLVQFHHEFLYSRFPFIKDNVVDISDWLHTVGSNAYKYYIHYLSLFLKDGILFENFAFNGDEHEFTRDVVLPSVLKLISYTKKKPLIVALEPTNIEGEEFWESYPTHMIDFVDAKLNTLR